jgi:hypothetical protein
MNGTRDDYKRGDRFSTNAWDSEMRKLVTVYGTVEFRRTMYGWAGGGTYLVRYDPMPTHIVVSDDHNLNGNAMTFCPVQYFLTESI